MTALLFLLVILIAALSQVLGARRAWQLVDSGAAEMHSRPVYHGFLALLWVIIAGWVTLAIVGFAGARLVDSVIMAEIVAAEPDAQPIVHELVLADARALATGGVVLQEDELRRGLAERYADLSRIRNAVSALIVLAVSLAAGGFALARIAPDWRARNRAEAILRGVLLAAATVAVLTTAGIVLSLIFETGSFFANIGWRVDKFLFGTTWSPLSGVQAGQLDPDKVGAVPLFAGTFLITLIAMVVATPVGLFVAIYLSEFAGRRTCALVKPVLEVLAGVPTVVYGFFAAISVAPLLRDGGAVLGLDVASESALAAGLVMGIMIIPFISSLSDDVINAVPQALRDGSFGLGATRAETIRQVVLPAALPGIVSAVLLAVSRAVGETMIVVMAAGQGANLSLNPLEAVTTVTVQIVALITGDTEASTAAGPAFTLGFTLFCVTLGMNVIAQRIVRRYRELYD